MFSFGVPLFLRQTTWGSCSERRWEMLPPTSASGFQSHLFKSELFITEMFYYILVLKEKESKYVLGFL